MFTLYSVFTPRCHTVQPGALAVFAARFLTTTANLPYAAPPPQSHYTVTKETES